MGAPKICYFSEEKFRSSIVHRNVSLTLTHKQGYSDKGRLLTAAMYQTIAANNQYDFRMCWRYAPVAMPLAIERGETMAYEKMHSYYIHNKPALIKNASRFLYRESSGLQQRVRPEEHRSNWGVSRIRKVARRRPHHHLPGMHGHV